MPRPMHYNAAVAIAPSDTVDFAEGPCDALFVGTGGIVPVVFQDNRVVNFTVATGSTLLVKARRINFTNCTALLMNAMYEI